MLDAESIEMIERRAIALPEDLRLMRCGPLEILFRPLEEDGRVDVFLCRSRRTTWRIWIARSSALARATLRRW